MSQENLFNRLKHFTQKHPINIMHKSKSNLLVENIISLHKTVTNNESLVLSVLKKRPIDNKIKVSF